MVLSARNLLALAAATLAAGASAAPRYDFAVQVTGKGKPILLIPGLTCSGRVWDATVASLKSKYQCHVLTLPGFGGQPPAQGASAKTSFLAAERDEIIRYVREKRLKRPAIIGHSLGGFMAFSLASREPDLFGPIVAVDGVPWLLALMNPAATLESAKPQIEAMEKAMQARPPNQEEFRASTAASLRAQITDPKQAEWVLETAGKSDPATVSSAVTEMVRTDLRADVAKIKSPVLLLAAGQWAKAPAQRELLLKGYAAQVAAVKNAKVVPIWTARHFIMLDVPGDFLREVSSFLEQTWTAR